MSAADGQTSEQMISMPTAARSNLIAASAFGLWGAIHVVVGAIGIATYLTGGTAPMLAFVDLDAGGIEQASRMSDLIVQFYHALLLIGLTSVVIGASLNRRGTAIGLALNVVLVANIEVAFVWFEVLPGHRPTSIAVITVGLLALGTVFGWLGLNR